MSVVLGAQMQFDLKLARAKINAAILGMTDRSGPMHLRPSNIGGCVLALKLQLGTIEDADPRRAWAALQGQISEELIGAILDEAGCEVLRPPAGQETWLEHIAADPSTGFKPHIDRLIRWPAVGLDEWCVLELKNLRAFGQISLFTGLLSEDPQYWYQAVTYLMQAEKAIEQYAAVEATTFQRGPWQELRDAGVVPRHLLFLTVAKDPSTTRMLLGTQLKAPKYETEPNSKAKPEVQVAQAAKTAERIHLRARLEEVGGDIDFYFELHDREDEFVVATYEDVKRRIPLIMNSESAMPLLFEAISDLSDLDNIPSECGWCSVREQHQMLQLEFSGGAKTTDQLFERMSLSGEGSLRG